MGTEEGMILENTVIHAVWGREGVMDVRLVTSVLGGVVLDVHLMNVVQDT